MRQTKTHDHTHVAATQAARPLRHSHAIAPGQPHLHGHDGHARQAEPEQIVSPTQTIAVCGVCAGYFGRDVLDNVSFCANKGDFIGIIGPNGSGKSTLLKAIAGLHPLQCGSINVFGEPPRSIDRSLMAYVPQIESVNWSFPVSVFDVVLMGRYGRMGLFRRPHKADRDATMAALEEVGMAGDARSQISQLSGGQQQRVFVARALVQEPQLMLLDEPIAGVDATSQHAIFTLLEERQQRGMTIIATTHDLSCVASWFDKVLCLNHHVIAYGPPVCVLNDATLSETYGSHVLIIPQAAPGPIAT